MFMRITSKPVQQFIKFCWILFALSYINMNIQTNMLIWQLRLEQTYQKTTHVFTKSTMLSCLSQTKIWYLEIRHEPLFSCHITRQSFVLKSCSNPRKTWKVFESPLKKNFRMGFRFFGGQCHKSQKT